MAKHGFVPSNIFVPRVDKVNVDKRQLTTGSEMTQLILDKLFKERKGQVFPVHLLNVFGKSLDMVT